MSDSFAELGNIGDFLSGVMVVVSLFYVAIQLKSGTAATRFDSWVKARAMVTEYQKLLVNPEIGSIWLRGIRDPSSLTTEERLSFYNLMYILMNSTEIRRMSTAGSIQLGETLIPTLAASPGFLRWWKQGRGNYSPSFREYVDNEIARARAPLHSENTTTDVSS